MCVCRVIWAWRIFPFNTACNLGAKGCWKGRSFRKGRTGDDGTFGLKKMRVVVGKVSQCHSQTLSRSSSVSFWCVGKAGMRMHVTIGSSRFHLTKPNLHRKAMSFGQYHMRSAVTYCLPFSSPTVSTGTVRRLILSFFKNNSNKNSR